MNKYSSTLSHVKHMEFAWIIVSSQWVTEVLHKIPTPEDIKQLEEQEEEEDGVKMEEDLTLGQSDI